jgi:hypothetical protein
MKLAKTVLNANTGDILRMTHPGVREFKESPDNPLLTLQTAMSTQSTQTTDTL